VEEFAAAIRGSASRRIASAKITSFFLSRKPPPPEFLFVWFRGHFSPLVVSINQNTLLTQS